MYKLLHQQDSIKYDVWVDRFRPNLAEVMAEFPSVTLPAVFLFSQLPPLQPRVYSISSSLAAHPGEVHITAGLTKYITRGNMPYFTFSSKQHNNEVICGRVINNQRLFSIDTIIN